MKKLLGIFYCSLFSQLLLAQITIVATPRSYHQLKSQLQEIPKQLKFTERIQQFTWQENQKNTFNLMQKEQQQMPAAYAYKDLAFFC
ncbi:MAG: hypothetical protein AB8G86_19525 [Saprospiraceae bacterium]